MKQFEFEKIVEEFHRIEDARDQLWDRAKNLTENGFEVEAYILILATWNFARFRYFMKTFDMREFQEIVNRVNPVFKKLEGVRFEKADFTNNEIVKDVKFIYDQLKKIAEQTGASKLMALKNPNLFVMWDTEIRRIYEIDNKGEAEDYIRFLLKMQENFKDIKWDKEKHPLAKAIDEYNYVVAEKNRKRKKSKSQKSKRK